MSELTILKCLNLPSFLCKLLLFALRQAQEHNIAMASYSIIYLSFLLLIIILPCIESSNVPCRPSSCSVDALFRVNFPFRLAGRPGQGARCGYPGFGLSCNYQNQTILNIRGSGDFSVKLINYDSQTVELNDPDGCLPMRLLNFSLSGSPFRPASAPRSFTFLKCSSSFTGAVSSLMRPVHCHEGHNNYTIVYALTSSINNIGLSDMDCEELGTVWVPIAVESGWDLAEGIVLTWDKPDCKSCLARGGVCGLTASSRWEVGCTDVKSQGLPRTAKYGIIIGLGIPGLLCLIGIACCVGSGVCTYGRRQHNGADYPDLSSLRARPLELRVTRGLDGPTIESYPKTLLGESRRLPNPDDNTCPICLSEYRPKDILRTIPECNHYFHNECINQWLRMNSTCPMCRNSPNDSSIKTNTGSVSTSASSRSP